MENTEIIEKKEVKGRKNPAVSPIVTVGAMMLLVVVITSGAYLLSIRLSAAPANIETAKVEPTPMAPEKFDIKGDIDCTNVPNTAPYGNKCVEIIVQKDGTVAWMPGAIEILTSQL